ncbi:MAG: MBL fold metallo-hydrolase [Acidobacteriota bacterium]
MAIKKDTLAYIAKTKLNLKPLGAAHRFKTVKKKVPFLWGDAVYVISTNSSKTTFSAKGHHFEIRTRDLMEDGLLCLWQVDCGQGDAAILRFPNGKMMMIDGGPGPLMTNSPAMAPAFLYWMRWVDQSWREEFDHGGSVFDIDALVCTHPDYDHYGGFLDLTERVESGSFRFGTVYHDGLARFDGDPAAFENGQGMSQLGPVAGTDEPDLFLTTLIDGFDDVRKYSRASGGRRWKLSSLYGRWLKQLQKLEGQGVERLARVHFGMGELPHFDAGPDTSVHVLGPVEERWKNAPALRFLDKTSKSAMGKPSLTRNGVSVTLRIDHGDVRLLMTGDLNFRSQAVLLKNVPSIEFKCHVAKACHHGSDDVSTIFLRAMSPLATLFSSGDNETHAHPRAKVLAMAGAFSDPITGGRKLSYLGLEEREHLAPLIYSTELSRSVALYEPAELTKDGERVRGARLGSRGADGRKGPEKPLRDWYLADDLIYGLINVRTDGEKVVIGVLKEGENAGFQVESFKV